MHDGRNQGLEVTVPTRDSLVTTRSPQRHLLGREPGVEVPSDSPVAAIRVRATWHTGAVKGVRLGRSFFERDPDEVARELVGCLMVVRSAATTLTLRVTETEAYGGGDDPESHAFRGPTPRNSSMFGPPGHLYVYRSYGVHWCMNVVTGTVGQASAVLLRAAEVVGDGEGTALRGPGLVTRFLGVTGEDDAMDCCRAASRVSFHRAACTAIAEVARSPRIGISQARERPSRYYLVGALVSRSRLRADETA